MASPVEHLNKLEKWGVSLLQRIIRRSMFSPVNVQQIGRTKEYWQPIDPWKGNATKGQPLASGSHPVELNGQEWHRFNWLRDMRDFGGSQSRTLARRFALEWIDQNQKWSEQNWHPQLISDRIINIVLTWSWFAASANTSQQQKIANALHAHRTILEKDWKSLNSVNVRVKAITALILSSAFLDEDLNPEKFGGELIRESHSVTLSDGCHASRQPDLHFDLLKSLIEAKIGLATMVANITEPDQNVKEIVTTLEDSIIRMGSVARMWRHANGEMMRLLGSAELEQGRIDEILDRAGPKGRISNHAADAGFIRMASGRTILMMNTAPAPWAMPLVLSSGGRPEAGALSIEFSHGSNPIIINAGHQKKLFEDVPELAEALSGTAAFSTLSIDRSNASDITAEDMNGRLATADQAETGAASGGLLAESRHDGYEKKFGLVHQRRIFLATGGNDLRGEDSLLYTGAPGLVPHDAVIRFHLHPRINAQMSMGGDVLLKLPGTAAPWLFKAKGADVRVEDSVVLGPSGMMKCAQITLTIPLDDIRTTYSKMVKWALRRQSQSTKKQNNT